MTFYTAGTTTLANVYRDSGLSSAMTNPTSGSDSADANGWFPQVFASEGANFDIILKTSGGSTLASYLSVAAIGAQSGSLSRDFTNSRFAASGTSGIVSLEAGDPTGDNVGGKMRVGGWAGTQADDIELDGVLVNVTGRLKERSKKIPGTVYTEATATAAATLDITLPNDPAGVACWDIDILRLTTSADASLSMTISVNSGASFYTGATDYQYNRLNVVGAVVDAATSAGAANIPLTSTTLHGAAGVRGTIRVVGTSITATLQGLTAALAISQWITSGVEVANQTTATTLRITPSSGTITCVYRVIPVRGLGET